MTKYICLNLLKSNGRNREEVSVLVSASENFSPDHRLEQKDNLEQVMQIIGHFLRMEKGMLP